MKRLSKVGEKDAKRGLEVLTLYKNHLESFQSARTLEVSNEDKKHIDDLFLLTVKPVMYVCNVDEKSAVTGNKYVDAVKEALKNENTEIIVIAGAMEAEIAELDNEDDRKLFLQILDLQNLQ